MTLVAVIPAYNSAWCIERCIRGLLDAGFLAQDIVVSEDGSIDRTAEIAVAMGVRLVTAPHNSGAAAARNTGAAVADADFILFVDSDVVVYPNVRTRVQAAFQQSPDLDAVFGLYDDVPHCRSSVGRFRNLLHHYVHLHGPLQPHTFWTGCGAVRHSAFEKIGGFDARLRMMEDVELGLRLTAAGGRISLDREMRARHLKCWSVGSMIHMDFFDRAIPWSRLLLFRHGLVNELNIDQRHRIGAIAVLLLMAGLLLALLNPRWLLLSGAALLTFLMLNIGFHLLMFRRAGVGSGFAAIPLHLVHTLCAIAGFGWVFLAEFIPICLLRKPVPESLAFIEPLDCPPGFHRRP